jgi:hypothetical protein
MVHAAHSSHAFVTHTFVTHAFVTHAFVAHAFVAHAFVAHAFVAHAFVAHAFMAHAFMAHAFMAHAFVARRAAVHPAALRRRRALRGLGQSDAGRKKQRCGRGRHATQGFARGFVMHAHAGSPFGAFFCAQKLPVSLPRSGNETSSPLLGFAEREQSYKI